MMPSIAEIRTLYPQYSDMSDGALADALHGKLYADMPRAEFNAKIGFDIPKAPAAPVTKQPNDWMDTASTIAAGAAQGIPSGLVKGASMVGGMVGDVRDLAGEGIGWLANKAGYPLSMPGPEFMRRATPAMISGMPTSAQVRSGIESLTGPVIDPKTQFGKDDPRARWGERFETVAEFLPAAAAGPGGVARRVTTQALLPGSASQAAGEASEGTAAEPYARVAGALLGGAAGYGRGSTAAKAPTREALQTAADANYTAARASNLEIDPKSLQLFSYKLQGDLAAFGDVNAPKTFQILRQLDNPPPGATVTATNLDSLRRQLGTLAAHGEGADAAAAAKAKRAVDNYEQSIPPADILAGDPAAYGKHIKEGRGNVAALKTSEELAKAVHDAELQAAAANSGRNQNNATRQKMRAILTNENRGLGLRADEEAQMERIVRGTNTGNMARSTANLLGAGGGLGRVAVDMAGFGGAMSAGADPYTAAMVGGGLHGLGAIPRRIGNASTARQTRILEEMIHSRSPLAKQVMPPALPPNLLDLPPSTRAALIAALAAHEQR